MLFSAQRIWRLVVLILLLATLRYLSAFGLIWLPFQAGTAGYAYPSNDASMANLAVAFESRMGGKDGYDGKDPEEVVWARWKRAVQKKQPKKLLDAGCGLGRSLMRLGSSIKSCVAVDPDPQRLKTAFATCASVAVPTDASQMHFQYTDHGETCCIDGEFFIAKMQDSFEHLKQRGDYFDVIVSSQVIQHVSTQAAKQILQDFFALLAPDGLLLLSTTHVPEKGIGFNAENGTRLNQEQFNTLASMPHAPMLPVR